MQVNENSLENRPFTRDHFNASHTQVKSFEIISADGTRITQKLRVLAVIEESHPISIRAIARKTGLEIAAVCRCIKDLENKVPPLIRIGEVKESADTGRKVQHYVPFNYAPEGHQIQLFLNDGKNEVA